MQRSNATSNLFGQEPDEHPELTQEIATQVVDSPSGLKEPEEQPPKERMCKHCHEVKLIKYHKKYCDECSIIKAEEIREKKRQQAREYMERINENKEKLPPKERKCAKCENIILFPRYYCDNCKAEVEEKKKAKARELGKNRYHKMKDNIREQDIKKAEVIRKNLQEKFKKSIVNLGRSELIQLITDHYDKMTDIEDIKATVRELYPYLI